MIIIILFSIMLDVRVTEQCMIMKNKQKIANWAILNRQSSKIINLTILTLFLIPGSVPHSNNNSTIVV